MYLISAGSLEKRKNFSVFYYLVGSLRKLITSSITYTLCMKLEVSYTSLCMKLDVSYTSLCMKLDVSYTSLCMKLEVYENYENYDFHWWQNSSIFHWAFKLIKITNFEYFSLKNGNVLKGNSVTPLFSFTNL